MTNYIQFESPLIKNQYRIAIFKNDKLYDVCEQPTLMAIDRFVQKTYSTYEVRKHNGEVINSVLDL